MSRIIEREHNGRFRKGSSGNPGGEAPVVKEVQELACTHTEAIETLRAIMRDDQQPAAARVAAVSAILDRELRPAAAGHRRLGDDQGSRSKSHWLS